LRTTTIVKHKTSVPVTFPPSPPATNTPTITQGNWNKHGGRIAEDGIRTVEVKKAVDQTMNLKSWDDNFFSLSFQKQSMFASLLWNCRSNENSYTYTILHLVLSVNSPPSLLPPSAQ